MKLRFDGDSLLAESGSVDAGKYSITWSTQNGLLKYSAWIFDASKRWHRRHLATTTGRESFDIATKVCEAHARRATLTRGEGA